MKFQYPINDIILMPANINFSQMLLDYHLRNEDFLKQFEPSREEDFFTKDYQHSILRDETNNILNDSGYRFYIFLKNDSIKIIGKIGLNNIVRGCFQSCFLGYNMDFKHLNKGYMTSAINQVVSIGFDELSLHRIEANVMPRNKPSLRVLDKCGFYNEGLAKNYLKINGIWEDHIHMVKLNKNI